MKTISGALALSLLVFSSLESAWAEDSFVLPKNVWNAQARAGITTGISNRFGQEGQLWSLSRLNQTFDSPKIRQFVPEFQQLVDVVNGAFPNYRYGDAVNLGNLEFQGDPQYSYTAVVLARGLSDSWTLGIAVPFVRLDSDVRVVQTGANNARAIQTQVVGTSSVSPALNSAFDQLSTTSLTGMFQKTLTDKGYRNFGPYTQSFVGDIQLVSIWQYYQKKRWTLYHETVANLPTGPAPDPNNLQAPTTFGQTSINFLFHQNYRVSNPIDAEVVLGYWYYVPDRVRLRVPENRQDALPDPDRIEEVQRKLGDVITVGGRARYSFSPAFTAQAGIERCLKASDIYAGERSYDYSLLADNTDSYWDRAFLQLQYSTIDAFLNKQFAVPLQVAFLTSDYLGGRNVDRQQTNEIALKMFF